MRKILIAVAVTAILFYLPVALINSPAFQRWFLRTYKPFSPWKIEVKQVVLQPIPPRLVIEDLHMVHPGGHQIRFERLALRAKFWRLLRAQLSLDPLQIDALTVHVAKALKAQPKKKAKGLKLRTLLLIQNLLIEEGRIRKVALHLPGNKTLRAEAIVINLHPALLGGTSLALTFQKVEKPDIQEASFEVTTRFDKWSKNFPYINDVEGKVLVEEARFGRLPVQKAEAKIRYEDFHLFSERFLVQIKKRQLLGELDSRLQQQTFRLKLSTPEAIAIPEIGSAIRTFNVEGELNLDLELEGKGFKPSRSVGKGKINLTHRFAVDPQTPVQAQLAFDWSGGLLRFGEAKVQAGESVIEAGGSFHLSPPSLDVTFGSRDFPLAVFFNKFEDKNLHPIFGRGNFEGTVQGMGKTIRLTVQGEALEAGYGPLLAQKARVNLELTDAGLKLEGSILTEEKETGMAKLKMDYGPRRPGQIRPKTLHLEAQFKDHPLETLLPKGLLAGRADASLTLSGPAKNFEGKGRLSASTGEIFGIAFESLDFPFQLTPKRLVIKKANWVFPQLETEFSGSLTFDFLPSGLKISGSPLAGLRLDIAYRAPVWTIHSIQYQNPAVPDLFANVSGTVSKDSIRLSAKGKLNLEHLQWISRLIREGEGPFAFDVHLSGSPRDPSVQGQIHFENNLLSLRTWPLTVEELEGTLNFSDHTVRTEKLTGLLGAGTFRLRGSLTHKAFSPQAFDLSLKGKQLYFRDKAGKFRMDYDADLNLEGSGAGALLKGKITILDGRYTKDFNIIEEIKKGTRPPREIETAVHEGLPIRLDLSVRNLGDLFIDNNVGRIELAAQLHITGSSLHPEVEGSVEVTEGQIHYLGLEFDITRGFIEFRDPYEHPYLEIEAEQEIADAQLNARLHGRTNNLVMDLSGNSAALGPLERKDVISLILFGMTSSERHAQSQYQTFELGPALAAEQVAHILQRPVARATGLDVFRLEADPAGEEGRNRRLHLGKRITDRFHVEFTSDIDREDAVQTFLLEYWLTDFLILKGVRETEEEYQFNIGFRVKSR